MIPPKRGMALQLWDFYLNLLVIRSTFILKIFIHLRDPIQYCIGLKSSIIARNFNNGSRVSPRQNSQNSLLILFNLRFRVWIRCCLFLITKIFKMYTSSLGCFYNFKPGCNLSQHIHYRIIKIFSTTNHLENSSCKIATFCKL